MKAELLSISGTKMGKIDLPEQFQEEIRNDLIKRAVLTIHSHNRQRYGANPEAGKKTSANYRGRRGDYGSWMNKGMSRMKRIRIGSGYLTGRARFVPQAVKGRKAHPPKAEKNWAQKINDKERKKAIKAAIAATSIKELVIKRGHRIDKINLPLIVEDKLETLKKTKEVENVLKKIGCNEDLERVSKRKVRAGRGKMRGRKYKTKKGPLIVVSEDKEVLKAARNIAGVDIINVRNLNAEILAPGANPGRLTVWTKGAIELMKKDRLFM